MRNANVMLFIGDKSALDNVTALLTGNDHNVTATAQSWGEASRQVATIKNTGEAAVNLVVLNDTLGPPDANRKTNILQLVKELAQAGVTTDRIIGFGLGFLRNNYGLDVYRDTLYSPQNVLNAINLYEPAQVPAES